MLQKTIFCYFLLKRFDYIQEAIEVIDQLFKSKRPEDLLRTQWNFTNIITFAEDAIYYFSLYETSNQKLKYAISSIVILPPAHAVIKDEI